MFFETPPKSYLDLWSGGPNMATKSSYFLAVLLIANPFMLLFFQNCSPSPHERVVASEEMTKEDLKTEISYKVDKNLRIK